MVKRLRKRKVISSSDNEEPSFPPPSQRQASNSIIDSVLRTMFSQQSSTSNYPYPPTSTQPSTSTKASFLHAHAKSNKGLKGKSRLSSYKHTTLKKEGDPLEKGHRGRPKTLDFHIARIIFLPYGVDMPSLDEDSDLSEPTLANLFPVIRQSIALTSAQLSRLEAAGLARSNFRSYFQFNWEWTWPQVDSMLHGEFSQLFEVLDTHPKVANPNYNTSGMVGRQYKYLPPYLLCLRSHKEIVVAGGAEFPDGEVLFQKVKAGKRPSRDESEIILVTRNEIPLKLIAQWIKKQHLKGKGKHKAEAHSSAEETESQLWPKSDNGSDTDEQILSPISHCLKKHRIHEALDTDSEQAGPLHAGPSTLASTSAGPETIDLTDGAMDTTPVNDEVSPVLPDAPPTTPPLTPIQATSQPAPSSSFTIDTTLTNPWKGNRTFLF
ncbi:hypothetical protein EDD15DRAFT_2374738 [Pisolithus albus]|nr:hypothetical protein EDD15DRAFT_2374738 [Pisolithus albus]